MKKDKIIAKYIERLYEKLEECAGDIDNNYGPGSYNSTKSILEDIICRIYADEYHNKMEKQRKRGHKKKIKVNDLCKLIDEAAERKALLTGRNIKQQDLAIQFKGMVIEAAKYKKGGEIK